MAETEPGDEMVAAYRFVDGIKPRADAYDGAAPLWHGWALREAFRAGAAWQRGLGQAEGKNNG